MNIIKSLLNNDAVINGLFLLAGFLLTIMGGILNKFLNFRKSKLEIAYEKHIFFINLNHKLTLFLEDMCKYNKFDHSHLEYFHYQALANEFLEYLGSIKNTKFDKKTTNFLYNLYELQRSLSNDVFIEDEITIEGNQTATGYPEFKEEYYIDTSKLNETIEELRDINLKMYNRLFN